VAQGRHQHVGDDFAVFWQAGRDFPTGHPLYRDYPPGARPFKYPPFAAFLFVPLGLLPLPVAAMLFSLLNLVLWVAAGYLTHQIVDQYFPGRNPSRLPFLLAITFSAQFFLDNFHHVQMNGVIFVLVLAGIHAYLEQKDVRAAVYLVTATAIKITPIFFVAWLLIRGGRRTALAVPLLGLGCIVVPLLVRGPTTGAADLVEYHRSFLQAQQQADIGSYSAGQNLAALVTRMTRPVEYFGHGPYMYLPASERTAQVAYEVLWVIVLLVFLGRLVLLRRRHDAVSPIELSMVFLTSLLLSPITFTTHMVSLLFVFYTFLSIRLTTLSRTGRVIAPLLLVAIAGIGLSGSDLVGRTVYLDVRGYSLMAWTMLLLFVTAQATFDKRLILSPASNLR
jgi:alpha-1,2-mannosyltransferase